ncbi:anhydro-N-acetylmuramic acid kinase [Neptuniibacter sp. CAU 1671]|uniref:anhydro-N-acetylmuramic acid kinase n=1 Tax=Neptuniibacter sp. CAU 1671 TaxID=3032593 RepID=UPI0023DBE863|nr:anhydro-N-acetylmuramic acid kinase [Neptuniibacter sp. CAU 1671]MDF2182286.1 anhydro-N-acetylmuramic acid kinase [Neptuniibacter sp. CAU 1671]
MSDPADLYIGLMSGTSVDGIDAALVQFEPSFKLLSAHCGQYPDTLRAEILNLCQPAANEVQRIAQIDGVIADCFANAASELITSNNRHLIKAIGSHGQTVRHHPELGYSMQIGDPSRIAERTGVTTVGQFRQRDLAAGGQGAPLVPAFHAALFRKPDAERFILNIGGMANITHLPGNPKSPVTGFDTGPGNVLLDGWIEKHLQQPFDLDGQWAASGDRIETLLQRLMDEPFFAAAAPKSTGRERFNLAWLESQLSDEFSTSAPQDVQATLLALTAKSTADAIKKQSQQPDFEVYICGGGARNSALINAIKAELPEHKVALTSELGLDPDWVEAAAFAWLAWRCLSQQSGNLPEVTGAEGPRILGAIYPA